MSEPAPSTARLYLLVTLMLLLWAMNYAIGKIALKEFPALLIAGARAAASGIVLLPFFLWSQRAQPRIWRQLRMQEFLLLALFGTIQILFVLGLAKTSVAHASLGISLVPLMVLLLAALFHQERIGAAKIVGMLIALAGVLILQLAKEQGSSATLTGDVLLLLYALVFAFFTVKGGDLTRRYGSLAVNTIAYFIGAVVLAPLTIWKGSHFDFSRPSPAAWASLAFMILFAAVLASLIFCYVLTHMPATRVSAVLYLQPLVATLIAIPMLGEKVSIAIALGGILVISGVYITERA